MARCDLAVVIECDFLFWEGFSLDFGVGRQDMFEIFFDEEGW